MRFRICCLGPEPYDGTETFGRHGSLSPHSNAGFRSHSGGLRQAAATTRGHGTTTSTPWEGTAIEFCKGSKPANGKTPSPRTLNNKNGAVLGEGHRLARLIHGFEGHEELGRRSVVEAPFAFRGSWKWCFGMPLYLRRWRLAWLQKVLDVVDVGWRWPPRSPVDD